MPIKSKNDPVADLPNLSRREFIKLANMAAVGLLVGCGSGGSAETSRIQTDATVLALINGTLIDGTGADAVQDGVVVIRDGYITDAGPYAQVEIPIDAETIDVLGGTIMPGFINAHVHHAYYENTLRSWARGGVTTVRDLGNGRLPYDAAMFDTRDDLSAIAECARLVAAGQFINVHGGYPIQYFGAHIIAISSPAEARQAVNQLIDDGADVIKTAFESGYRFQESGWPLLSPDEATALVETAHERGKKVTAHVTSALDLPRALDAGVDEIAHLVRDYFPEELISRMVETGTPVVPTFEVCQDNCSSAVSNLARFVQAGGEVALGTDYYTSRRIDFELGMPMYEIRMMRGAGMTPMQIIVAATRNAARSCDMESELGTLEAGKRADVLVVNGDPLTNIYALTNTLMVLRDGKTI